MSIDKTVYKKPLSIIFTYGVPTLTVTKLRILKRIKQLFPMELIQLAIIAFF